MAGYGTTLQAPTKFDPLIRALLRAAQRRARTLNLRMQYRRHEGDGATNWDVTVDGNGYMIAAWSQWLERDLPIVAEGYAGYGAGRPARNIAVSLVARWTGWSVGGEERTAITATGADHGRWYWPVIDVPDPPDPLEPRLAISDGLIARWIAKDLPEEVAIEELHTAVEGLLRSIVGKGKWPQLLAKAETKGKLTSSERTSLDAFNVLYRIRLKHQVKALEEPERTTARDVMYEVLGITERLLDRL
jgi:hypothetical protein